MSTEVSPQLNLDLVSGSENDPSHDPPYLSRSPQPYAKYRPDAPPFTHRTAAATSKDFFDTDNWKRRKVPKSQSDSGTEADDESGPILKSLPAPPFKLRKGLKDDSKVGSSSPLLTPSYLDDVARKEVLETQFKRRGSAQSHASTDEEKVQIRTKFIKRRRAELLRRTTETLLLFTVGCLVCRQNVLLPIREGTLDPLQLAWRQTVCGLTVLLQMWLFSGLLYVARICCTQFVSSITIGSSVQSQ